MDCRISPWDKRKNGGGKASDKMMKERTLPEVLKARMKVVHPKCGEFMYGDRGAKDFEGLGLDLEATMGLAHENIFLDMSHKQARQRLLDGTKDDWNSIIVADEFLQSLDVVSNALRAAGIEFLTFHGHMTLKERDEVRARFDDPDDPVRVMLATIQCFGLGLPREVTAHSFAGTTKVAETIAYIALTDKTFKAKKELIKSEWLEAFKTLDETKKRPINNVSGASKPGTLAKKPRLVNIGENFKAFLNGEELSSKILERMAKDRIGQDREVTVWTYESPNSIEAYVKKTRKKKKKNKAKLAFH
ncbi:uncharacterized protein J4E84_007249 [Alternaria hordeiaustralica]|uniref:uncharacterized protein n=1 Tax=Alternaria hordeiaustralica TaxID=1187925 RepID=UPI0020C421AF|nr:uncharacterized protein J4E84_007249 [Alternaria hordeiaustralica]KAI4682784.1 hypothetical protein J4E84_007249 [Alternaria hordeiaustralica]